MTPFLLASCSIFAPDAASRSTIMSTLTPPDSIWRAMVCIFDAEPPAFWMLQLRLYFVQSALSAVGSAVTQRGEDVVSGRMMPTFAPLPSMAPPPPALLAGALLAAAGAEVAGAAEVAAGAVVAGAAE